MIPTDINELFKEALHDHVNGRIQEAFSKYTKILDLNLDHPETLHHLGLIYLHMGEITEAFSLIKKSLESLMKNKTVIIIAHRLSTLLSMDRILVFDEGEIKEEGTHDELLYKKGLYYKLWSSQVGGLLMDRNNA